MPSYLSHAEHGREVAQELKNTGARVVPMEEYEFNQFVEQLALFCVGPDALALTDYKTFEYQHANDTAAFFKNMVKLIKENGWQDNSLIMAYLYGQIDHFVLDVTIHPLIYYMTQGVENDTVFDFHALVELWLDDYVLDKYAKGKKPNLFRRIPATDRKLKLLISKLYMEVYGKSFGATKHIFGWSSICLFEKIRNVSFGRFSKKLMKSTLGDISHGSDKVAKTERLLAFNKHWVNPETGEEISENFKQLWIKSIQTALEIITDVNKCLYGNKNSFDGILLLSNDISYNTGRRCNLGQTNRYSKRYLHKIGI